MNNMSEKATAAIRVLGAITARSAFPIKLTVGLTYRCQSRCNYCNIWKYYEHNPELVEDEVKTGLHLKTIEDLKDDLVWIEFTGGEPFLRNDIAEIVSFAMNSTGVAVVGITSNGLDQKLVLRKTREMLSQSKKKRLVVGISIDGDPETYQRARGINGFNLAMQTFLGLKQLASSYKNLRPHIAYTINSFNCGNFPSFYRFMSEEHEASVSDISFAVEHPSGYYFRDKSTTSQETAETFKEKAIDDIAFVNRLRHRQKLKYSNPVTLFYDYYLKRVQAYFENPCKQVIPCRACKSSAYVDPYGNVYPCTMWKEILGNLRRESFRSIWNSEKRKTVAETVRLGKCPNCWTPCEAQPSWLLGFGPIRGWW
jgi:MoaA/NifB/PqqE/SkfB family radical SAM enzyme